MNRLNAVKSGVQLSEANDDDCVSLELIQGGSFEQFFEISREVVFGACVAMVNDRDYAADLAQDAFMRALQNWETVSVHPNPQAWVLRVARNMSYSNWRRIKRAARMTIPQPIGTHDPADQVTSENEVMEALLALPRSQRLSTYLVVIEGFAIDEAAAILGCSSSTVRTHLQRARKALQHRSGLKAASQWH